jgi:hypothetical protein
LNRSVAAFASLTVGHAIAAQDHVRRASDLLREHLACVGCDPLAVRITARLREPMAGTTRITCQCRPWLHATAAEGASALATKRQNSLIRATVATNDPDVIAAQIRQLGARLSNAGRINGYALPVTVRSEAGVLR